MLPADFSFDLPVELIAQQPLPRRRDSRLLVMDRANGGIADVKVTDFPGLVGEHDLLVFNDTRVIPARLQGQKASGGKVEVFVDRILDGQRVLAQVKASRSPTVGTTLDLPGGAAFTVCGRQGRLFELQAPTDVLPYLEQYGQVPLPPYIKRAPQENDAARYQTVFASRPGAVAAPTAGLHFDQLLLEALVARGAQSQYVTLHVGAGTFAPLPDDLDVETHRLHHEWLEVGGELCAAVAETRARGGRVIAIGTTSVRALETAAQHGVLQPYCGDTDLFIYPGYRFNVVDALLTNFHLPQSSLLMLVAAFAGREPILAAYEHAVAAAYRFFSYGDAMFIGNDVGP
jgi:S-adenosylmethionine:tRNA ribosyltransferase-isomerase